MITTMTTSKIENGHYIKFQYARCTECKWRESVLDLDSPLSTAREHEASHQRQELRSEMALAA